MRKENHVYMQCPNCKSEYEKVPTISRDVDGRLVIEPLTNRPRITLKLPTTCKKCGTNLVRRVERERS